MSSTRFFLQVLCVIYLGSFTDCDPIKHILFYTPSGSEDTWNLHSQEHKQEYFQQHNCPATNCIITSNHTYLSSIQDYDVIVMNSWHLPKLEAFPPASTRTEDQIYVMYFHESPTRTKEPLKEYSGQFNWTMSFQLNADIVLPYGLVHDKETGAVVAPSPKPSWRSPNFQTNVTKDEKVISLVQSKTKMAAWFVSSCNSPSQRKYLVQKMQEFIPVDIYGQCGTLSCVKKEKSGCRDMVEKDYKFYLSFENSLCTDYVTEKVLEMMQYYVIPVVYGGADYTRFLPPGSYINALEFDSVDDLVAHMTYLANNIEEYMKYFWWKDYYTFGRSYYCGLCEKINNVGTRPRFNQHYTDIDDWFKNGTCVEPKSIPLINSVLK